MERSCGSSHFGSSYFPLCCVMVSRSPFPRSSFVVRCCGFDLTVSSKFPPVNGEPMTFRTEAVLKRRKERDSWWAKCARTSCWLKHLSSMAGKSGNAASAPIPTCGQQPSVGDAKRTFQRGCMDNICKQRPQVMGAVGRLRHPRVRISCWRTKPSGATGTEFACVA